MVRAADGGTADVQLVCSVEEEAASAQGHGEDRARGLQVEQKRGDQEEDGDGGGAKNVGEGAAAPLVESEEKQAEREALGAGHAQCAEGEAGEQRGAQGRVARSVAGAEPEQDGEERESDEEDVLHADEGQPDVVSGEGGKQGEGKRVEQRKAVEGGHAPEQNAGEDEQDGVENQGEEDRGMSGEEEVVERENEGPKGAG